MKESQVPDVGEQRDNKVNAMVKTNDNKKHTDGRELEFEGRWV